MCLWCNYRFQCSQAQLYRKVQCQKCFRKFHAFEVSPHKAQPPGSSFGFSSSRTGFQETVTPAEFSKNHGSQTCTPQSSKPAGPTTNGYGSRSKKERHDPPRRDGGLVIQMGLEVPNPRKKPSVKPSSGTNRHKVNVTYKGDESEDDVDIIRPRKRLKKDGFIWLEEPGHLIS